MYDCPESSEEDEDVESESEEDEAGDVKSEEDKEEAGYEMGRKILSWWKPDITIEENAVNDLAAVGIYLDDGAAYAGLSTLYMEEEGGTGVVFQMNQLRAKVATVPESMRSAENYDGIEEDVEKLVKGDVEIRSGLQAMVEASMGIHDCMINLKVPVFADHPKASRAIQSIYGKFFPPNFFTKSVPKMFTKSGPKMATSCITDRCLLIVRNSLFWISSQAKKIFTKGFRTRW
jgi:hypothetical protein